MKIIIDTNNLSELDLNMLTFLAEQGEVAEQGEDAPAEETPAPTKAKKAKPAAAAEPETDGEANPETDGEAPTLSDAVTAATQLVSNGQQAVVKAALDVVGAKRVGEMKPEDVPAFLAALEV